MEFRRRLTHLLLRSRDLPHSRPVRSLSTTHHCLEDIQKSPTMSSILVNTQSLSAPIPRLPGSPITSTRPANALQIPPISASSDRIPRMGPSAGRSVVVMGGEVASAFTRLRFIVNQNNVRYDERRQKFHERPGSKRKRLKSERHRKRFKAGFKRMIKVVLEMKKKGL